MTYVPYLFTDTANIDSVVGRKVYFNPVTLEGGRERIQRVQAILPASGTVIGRRTHLQANLRNNTDAVVRNDTAKLITTIIGSYDPNDKAVSLERLTFPVIEPLEYTIRFQNTGNDTAFSVIIRDTLSPWLKIESITKFSSTHPAQFRILPGGVLEVRYENILLPDSNVNERGSHGSFSFTITPSDRLPLGTTIPNKASIYFDFNEPVVTNTVRTSFLVATRPTPVAPQQAQWVPNPTAGPISLRAEKAPTGKLFAINAAGQAKPLRYTYSDGHIHTNLQGLTNGIYLLRFEGGNVVGRVSVVR
jgi:uncharacterized repeat protein (TIGR01451 family)